MCTFVNLFTDVIIYSMPKFQMNLLICMHGKNSMNILWGLTLYAYIFVLQGRIIVNILISSIYPFILLTGKLVNINNGYINRWWIICLKLKLCKEVIFKDIWSDFSIRYFFFTHLLPSYIIGWNHLLHFWIFINFSQSFLNNFPHHFINEKQWWWFKTIEIKIEKAGIPRFLENLPMQYVDFP